VDAAAAVFFVARWFAREVVTTREHQRDRRSPGVLEREVRGPTDRALRFRVDLLAEAQQRLLADLVGIVEVNERRARVLAELLGRLANEAGSPRPRRRMRAADEASRESPR
jgi:hypothetical protein